MLMQMCHYAGCDRICKDYYCSIHKPIIEKQKQEREKKVSKTLFKNTKRRYSGEYNNLYHSAMWKALRKNHLIAFPRCAICNAPATVVDHIQAHKGNLNLFMEANNLQSLCKSCHTRKTLWEQGYFINNRGAKKR